MRVHTACTRLAHTTRQTHNTHTRARNHHAPYRGRHAEQESARETNPFLRFLKVRMRERVRTFRENAKGAVPAIGTS